MALLNEDAYGDLSRASVSQSRRAPGKFFSIFITGETREKQEIGKMQCMTQIEDGRYLINNSEEIFFIPYFIKRYWEKYIDTKGKSGKYSKLVAFGWNEDVPKIDDLCKYTYTIAGLVLDSKTKKAIMHAEDFEDSKIKKGDPILIHFRCGGIKFNKAMKFVDQLATKAKDLKPLSNSPEFERNVVTPRRFICTAKVAIESSEHGNKNVFEFDPVQQLPDSAIEQVMNSAMELLSEFEKQFDRSAFIKSGPTINTSSDGPTFEESAPKPTPDSEPSTEIGENFDLGI